MRALHARVHGQSSSIIYTRNVSMECVCVLSFYLLGGAAALKRPHRIQYIVCTAIECASNNQ